MHFSIKLDVLYGVAFLFPFVDRRLLLCMLSRCFLLFTFSFRRSMGGGGRSDKHFENIYMCSFAFVDTFP